MKLAYMFFGPQHTALKYYGEQLGIRYAVASSSAVTSRYSRYAGPWDYIPMRALKQDLLDHGMDWMVYEGLDFMDGVKLGNEHREEDLAHFKTMLENMHLLGIHTVCYNWMPVWEWFRTRNNLPLPGGATSTGFKYADIEGAKPCGTFISKDQLWTNLESFLKEVVPLAEKYKIKLAIHPDDPPVDEIAGVERILTSAKAMEEVTKLVPSEYNGITLCQGTFGAMGEDVIACIKHFAEIDKLFFAHFRDLHKDETGFQESFHHDGMTDMYKAMKTYYEVGFDGVMRPDHVPAMYGDNNETPSYGIYGNLFATGYMYGLMESIEKELGYPSSFEKP